MPDDKMIVREEGGLIATDEILSPVMNLQVAKKRLAEFQEFVKEYLVKDEDFGIIPGTPKPTLYKPGADKLCELYGLGDSYEIVDKVEDYDAKPPLFDYTIRATLVRLRTGQVIATGLGSCNTYESRYRWRKGARKCPTCGKESIIKGKAEYGGGWLCWQKKDGCGAKFKDGDPAIEKQNVDRVENEDIIDQKNTVLKMAKKRAKIDATLAATRSSGMFTQDIEDMAQFNRNQVETDEQDQRPDDTASPTQQAKGKGRAKVEDVRCAQCSGVNGHTEDCPTIAKKAEPAKPEIRRVLVVVDEAKKQKTGNDNTPEEKRRPYIVLRCHFESNETIDIYAFHATPQKHASKWVGNVCEFEITEKLKADKSKFWHLEQIVRCADQMYKDNEPVASGKEPDGKDLFGA